MEVRWRPVCGRKDVRVRRRMRVPKRVLLAREWEWGPAMYRSVVLGDRDVSPFDLEGSG
jgi:hypothetical protein